MYTHTYSFYTHVSTWSWHPPTKPTFFTQPFPSLPLFLILILILQASAIHALDTPQGRRHGGPQCISSHGQTGRMWPIPGGTHGLFHPPTPARVNCPLCARPPAIVGLVANCHPFGVAALLHSYYSLPSSAPAPAPASNTSLASTCRLQDRSLHFIRPPIHPLHPPDRRLSAPLAHASVVGC